ncbi:hypothetical protein V6N12_053940 [Hibiscus sabdariffa]|uniref:Uncharacterized protein n=1 Tax=Hibiscus sabdariffa TaxID=183260 RepID=A0ABR2D915_9ROSI
MVVQAPVSRRVSNSPAASLELTPMLQESQAAIDELDTGHTTLGETPVIVEESDSHVLVNIPVGESSHVALGHEVTAPISDNEEICETEAALDTAVNENVRMDSLPDGIMNHMSTLWVFLLL